ncbi:MAG TPA: DNA polymerase III subunit delta' [Bacillota bacterium]|nr:DNA polymerase III subunit delta' [Bacillota bacterium]
MSFNKIIGQKIIIESLRNAVKNNKVSNGYIFSGPEGCGKKLMANTFAMALNCSGTADHRPCGSCSSCIRTSSGNHPDVGIVRPDGQSIKIRQIRYIISETAKKPFENGYKVIIFENAEKMTHDAQDAFLKTLEEPPDNTVFILLVENYSLLLPAIVSRCQVHRFKPINASELRDFLGTRYDCSSAEIESAIRHSKGVVGRALELLTDKESFKIRAAYIDILEKALLGSCSEALLLASEKIASREEAEKFLEFSLSWVRDLIVLRENKEAYGSLIINTDNSEMQSKHNSALTEDELNSIIEIIKKTIMYIRHNVGIKNSIEVMLFNIAEVSSYNG